jgi:hypothetical protein
MEAYRVFISSIMNRSTEDLGAEREAMRTAVEHFAPITTAWAFETEPASPKPLLDFYIGAVKSCDLFMLIVGERITKPVKDEYDTARHHGKPILVFAKNVSAREPDAAQLLHAADVKYDTFINAAELREKVRRSLAYHILTLIRGGEDESFRSRDLLAELRASAVRITPMVPAPQYDSFWIKSVQPGVITLEKGSNRQTLTVPAQRIEDLLIAGQSESPTLLLNGRLQWITLPAVWRFFPERPASNDPGGVGFGKETARNNPGVPSPLDTRCVWTNSGNIATRLHDGYEVFYDEDGKHLCSVGQILLVRPILK